MIIKNIFSVRALIDSYLRNLLKIQLFFMPASFKTISRIVKKIFPPSVKLACMVFLLNLYTLQAQVNSRSQGLHFMHNMADKTEIYFSFEFGNKDQLDVLSRFISIDRLDKSIAFAYATPDNFKKFAASGLKYTLLDNPSTWYLPVMKNDVDVSGKLDWDFYPTYEAYISMMEQFAALYPDLCEMVEIGTTIQGRKIVFAKISDQVQSEENEPRFMYTSSIHGDEITGYVLMLRLIDYLLSGYSSSDEIRSLVDNLEIWINPLANPDGTYRYGNNTVYNATRFNANNIDLNRNFPDPQDGPHPDGNDWQTETLLFMDFADSLQFVMSANLHGGAEVCNFPWDTWQTLHADDDWFYFICREYADTVHVNSFPGYFDDMDNGVTNGYAWYTISGGRQDYMNYFHHCREITLEISLSKILPESLLPAYWDYNYRSLLGYMEQSMYGFTGFVRDSATNAPVQARVVISGHDMDNSFVNTNPAGKYFRPVMAGTYNLTFSAPGYATKTYWGLQVNNFHQVVVDAVLVNDGSSTGENLQSGCFLYPNPATGGSVRISGIKNNDRIIRLELFNIAGLKMKEKIPDRDNLPGQLILETEGLRPGTYLVKVSGEVSAYYARLIVRD